MGLTVDAIIAGLGIGAVYGLIAIGFTVGFTTTRVLNLAQGDLVMLGVMGSWYFLDVERLPQWATFLIVTAGVALIAGLEERLIVRPFLKEAHGSLGWFIATLAFSLVLETIIISWYGDQPAHAVASFVHSNGWNFGSITISPPSAVAVSALVIVALGLEVFYRRTWNGLAMKASAEDRDIAMLRGVDPYRLSTVSFLISGAIAGAGGFVLAPFTFSDPTIGLTYTVQGFMALAIGGFGSVRGAVIGALLLGVTEQVFDHFGNSQYELAAGLVLLLAVLLIRPTGIFASQGQRRI